MTDPVTDQSSSRLAWDDAQRAVLEHGDGALLALGGPGTGKTRVLEERFVRLALAEGCSPDRILFLVPNRAQKIALQDRITRRLLFEEGLAALVEVPIYTWHGLANHLVTRHYDRLAYPEPPVLLTSPEQWGSVRDALQSEDPVNWPHHKELLGNRGFVDEVVDFIIRVEQRLLEPRDLERIREARPEWGDLIDFYFRHREQMRSRSRLDYPTLLADATDLIANHDDVRSSLHQRFLHVLVDDAQELAFVQQRLLRFLTGFVDEPGVHTGRSVVVAADADSAIEHFRGADPEWLRGFDKDFGSHDAITLSTTYRMGAQLGAKVSDFIGQNDESIHRPSVFAGSAALEVSVYGNLAAEMEAVARELRLAHLRDGVAFQDMAILLTSPRSMLPALERALRAVEVPYAVSAPDRPLDREPAVRTFIQLAEYAFENESDPDELADLLRSPLVGLETHEVREIERLARTKGNTVAECIESLATGEDPEPRLAHLRTLRSLLRDHMDGSADETFYVVWEAVAHYAELVARARADLSDPANREIDALVAFSRALGRFVERRRGRGTLKEYLDAIGRADFGSDPWLPPERSRAGAVQILSFHAAKGKEWDVVAVSGCVEGMIPKGRRAQGLFDPYFLDSAGPVERVRHNEAEDRRVFYVATTRARKRCLVTTSPGPTRKGQPSRFIAEMWGELPGTEPGSVELPLTFAEAAARQRRILNDPERPAAERLAALSAIAKICELDPSCRSAQPAEWWWRWDWTEGGTAINEQAHRDEGMAPDKLRTSYSRLQHYDNCPLAYLMNTVLGLDPDVTHNLHFGRWIHEIFEDCEKEPTDDQKRTGRRRLETQQMAYERYEELFDESVFPSATIARQFKADGRVMIQNYGRYLRANGVAEMTEHGFNIDIDGHRVRGRIDRVDKKGKNLVISDYKTSRNEIQYDEARDSLQLALYYKAAKEDPEIAALGEPAGMQLLYPFKVVRNDMSNRRQNPEQAEEVLKRLPVLIDGVLQEDFRPSPEANCRWCKFKPLCPLWPEGRELPPL